MDVRVREADDDSFEALVLKADRPVLVDFSAAWCGPCRRLEPVVHEIATDFTDRILVVKVDVDRAPNTAARYAILHVPRLLLFRDGDVRDRIDGVPTKRALAERVERVLES